MSFDIARTNEIKTIDKNITVTGKDKKKKKDEPFSAIFIFVISYNRF